MDKRVLSNSSLSLMRECPRCFWLQMNKNIRRPSGIFPSLPGGVDIQIKRRFDDYREMGLVPSEVDNQIPGLPLSDQTTINNWRNWRKGLRFSITNTTDNGVETIEVVGALDDCFVSDECYYPVDFKTRGYPLKDDGTNFYKDQLDLYTLLLVENGFRTAGLAYLVYYFPIMKDGQISFITEVKSCLTDYMSARHQIDAAIQILNNPTLPLMSHDCAYCIYSLVMREFNE